MALTKEQKKQIIDETTELLSTSKLSVVVNYEGTSVKDLGTIRKIAKNNGSIVKIIKNRLFIQSMNQVKDLKESDKQSLNKMLLYVFNSEDEVSPAKTIFEVAKTIKSIEFVGSFQKDGKFLNAQETEMVAQLPTKQQLRGQLAGTIAAPLSGFVAVINNNLASLINVLKAKQEITK